MDRTLIFATGGIAFADGDYTAISPGGTRRSESEMSVGGVLGGGIEFAITDNMVVRGEGLYYIFDDEVDLGASPGEENPPNRAELDDAFAVRLGLSFNF
jgi:outer membrane immunogenic protein